MTSALSSLPLTVRLLLEAGALAESGLTELTACRRRFPASVEDALVYGGLVHEELLARVFADHVGTAWVGLGEGDEEERLVELWGRDDQEPELLGTVGQVLEGCADVARAIGETVCRARRAMPVAVQPGTIHVVFANPCDFAGVEELRVRSGRIVRAYAGTLGLVDDLLGRTFGAHDIVKEISAEGGGLEERLPADDEDDTRVLVDLQRPIPVGKDSQVVRMVNAILRNAIEEGASDIHIEPYEDAVRVRYRVDGRLQEVSPPPRSLFVPMVSRLKILAKMDIAEKRIPQDGAIALKSGDKRVDLRVSTVPTVYGEKMVIRLLEKEGIPDRLEKLGFTEQQADMFLEAALSPHGLIFVTGPTGSGKSTTLYCCLQLINQVTDNIVTVEDPVEYKFHGLNQVQVHSKVGLTFASALRSFLRQDPDKLMVGEVRDQETAEICMRAALTGHLVLSTLHTNNSLQVINRLVDMGIEPFLLAPALRLVQAQRLVRRLCDDCKEPYELPERVAVRYALPAGLTLYRARIGGDCPGCKGRGSRGRVGIYEVVRINEALRDLVASRAEVSVIERAARAAGASFLDDSARLKLRQGLVGLEEVAEYIKLDEPGV